MNLLATEREYLSNTIVALKDEINRNSDEHDSRLQRYEEEVQLLQRQHQVALSDRRRFEKAAEDATMEGNEIKDRKARIENELEKTREEVGKICDSRNSVLEAHDGLKLEASELKTRLLELERDKEAANRMCSRLEDSIATMEKEKESLMDELAGKVAKHQELKDQVSRFGREQQEWERQLKTLEASRREDFVELERLRVSNKSLTLSLKEAEKHNSALDDARSKDREQIKQLDMQLQGRKNSHDEILAENQNMKNRNRDLEHKLKLIDGEIVDRESRISRLQEKCKHLEEEVSQRRRDGRDLENENANLGGALRELEDEFRSLAQAKASSETMVQQLKDRLENEISASTDQERIREKYMQSERNRKDLEVRLTSSKAEFLEAIQQKTTDIISCQHRLANCQEELRLTRQNMLEQAELKDAEIHCLKKDLETCITKLDASRTKIIDLEAHIQGSEKNIVDVNETLEKYSTELERAKDELKLALEENESRSQSSDKLVESLKCRIEELENDLSRLALTSERSSKRAQQEISANQILSLELDNMKYELSQAERKVVRLEQELYDGETERRELEKTLSAMKASVRKHQSNAKRFDLLFSEQRDLSSLVDSLQAENEELNQNLLKMRREREACLNCLERGREKLAQLVKEKEGFDLREWQTLDPVKALKNYSQEIESSQLYLTQYPVDGFLGRRAEELVTCLAASAKKSLSDSQMENSNLRAQMTSIKEEKEAEVASLKSRIRFLEVGSQSLSLA